MEEVRIRNLAELRGVLAAAPVFSHMSRGERFFIFPIETRRLSGAVDRINVVARQSLLDAVPTQTYDARMDGVVTPKHTIVTREETT